MSRSISGNEACRSATGRLVARLLLACAVIAAPASSLAAVTDVSIGVIDGFSTLVIAASGEPGLVSRIVVNWTSNNTKYTVSEGPNATIVAGPGCVKRPGQNVVDCTSAGVTHARVFLWDGADVYENNTQLFGLVFAGSGDDVITTGCGADIVYGEQGKDTIIDQGICGGFGFACESSGGNNYTNCLFGGSEDDTIKGPLANVRDKISGDGGNDKLYGRGGADLLIARDQVGGDIADCGGGSPDIVQIDAGDTSPGCEIFQ
jgi:Ca2+-binding RTX toxin-like protein